MIPLDNQTIRKETLARCKQLSCKQRQAYSRRITEKCQALIRNDDVIALFMPLSYEPDITALFYHNHNQRFALPKVLNQTDMCFVEWNQHTRFIDGPYHITEPDYGIEVSPQDLSIIFVPLVAYNKHCERIGHGNGYYDRYLKKCNALKIGVAFSLQHSELFQTYSHDIVLDGIITETECILPENTERRNKFR